MFRGRSKLKVRITAAGALLGFLLLWVAPGAALAASAYREACTMTMCVEQGFCCCLPTDSGHPTDRHLESSKLVESCPGQCAQAQIGSSHSARDLERAPEAGFTAVTKGARYYFQKPTKATDTDRLSASPRGPPSTTLAVFFSSSQQV